MSSPIESTVPASSNEYFPAPLAHAEAELIKNRRVNVGVDPAKVTAGIGLSGGGIRSATFCLGVLQALAKAEILTHFDYISTVSGGGYAGSFLGAWISRTGNDAKAVQKALPDCDTAQVGFLRENGRYIAPNGSGDLWAAFATFIRSWVAILFVLGTFAFSFFLLAALLRQLIWDLGPTLAPSCEGWATLPGIGQWFWPSAWLVVSWYAVVALVAPLIVAYWMLGNRPKAIIPFTVVSLLVLIGAPIWSLWSNPWSCSLDLGGGSLRWLWFLGSLVAIVAWLVTFIDAGKDKDMASVRRGLTNTLVLALATALGLTAFGLIDSAAASLLAWVSCDAGWKTGLVHGCAALLLAISKISWPHASKSLQGNERPSLSMAVAAGIGAGILAFVLFTLMDFWALRFAQFLGAPSALGDGHGIPKIVLFCVSVVALCMCAAVGRPLGFVNLSSLHKIYSARLTRSYLGASNPDRFNQKTNPAGQNITEPVEGDDIAMADYHPHKHGGALHLINVTVNETISGRSQIEQRDRHGMGMAIGPAGLSLGRVHHALFVDPRAVPPKEEIAPSAPGPKVTFSGSNEQTKIFPIKPPEGCYSIIGGSKPELSKGATFAEDTFLAESREMERLPLGEWVGVSGAAFSTGMGAQTSLGITFLAGLFDVRLGYWWDSGVEPGGNERTRPSFVSSLDAAVTKLFPAQMFLISELLARFHGTARRYWYLSDGGHFENTAVYELIRRRVPIILACDCGADPRYTFEDIGNLVRKARLDFDADIVFKDPAGLKKELGIEIPAIVGSLDDLRQTTAAGSLGNISKKHAAIALVYYDGKEKHGSVLLVIKPTITGNERTDILNYRSAHPLFPQEPTADQFFDEAQWESYRKLGEAIGHGLFHADTANDQTWIWKMKGA